MMTHERAAVISTWGAWGARAPLTNSKQPGRADHGTLGSGEAGL